MTDRENVISDLEQQIAWIRDNDFHKFPGWGHAVLAMRDAIVLLKAQEPRVLTTLELYDAEGMQGFIETRKGIRPCFLVHHRVYPEWCFRKGTPGIERHMMGIMDSQNIKRFWEFKLYNKTWRCWTSRPTDAQREAAPWK